ncbi:8-oxo-dGTP diphosphatase, partial [Patescibacteria group bacterium]|nr:8-oxo-dGTP diphosphatase [Patescibacteria group bacterium]
VFTLCIVHEKDKILLGMKKRGFGKGKWNGFGGKVKKGEDIEKAMKRDLQEEAGIISSDFEKRGILKFTYKDEGALHETHVFCVKTFTGEPVETEEMKPQWFLKEEVPFESMWPDDKHWFPLFLRGKQFEGSFWFDDKKDIIDYTLKEVDSVF